MKKIFITTILFLLALTALAIPDKDLQALLKYGPVNLGFGIKQPDVSPAINDFSRFDPFDTSKPYVADIQEPLEECVQYQVFEHWFAYDFAEEPFDGRIEPLVLGEPLPSPGLTLALALGTAGIILLNRKRKLT